MFEDSLRNFIDVIREDGSQRGAWSLPPHQYESVDVPSLVISLPRFQSYRGRTEAALIQELEEYIVESGKKSLNYEVFDGLVQLW